MQTQTDYKYKYILQLCNESLASRTIVLFEHKYQQEDYKAALQIINNTAADLSLDTIQYFLPHNVLCILLDYYHRLYEKLIKQECTDTTNKIFKLLMAYEKAYFICNYSNIYMSMQVAKIFIRTPNDITFKSIMQYNDFCNPNTTSILACIALNCTLPEINNRNLILIAKCMITDGLQLVADLANTASTDLADSTESSNATLHAIMKTILKIFEINNDTTSISAFLTFLIDKKFNRDIIHQYLIMYAFANNYEKNDSTLHLVKITPSPILQNWNLMLAESNLHRNMVHLENVLYEILDQSYAFNVTNYPSHEFANDIALKDRIAELFVHYFMVDGHKMDFTKIVRFIYRYSILDLHCKIFVVSKFSYIKTLLVHTRKELVNTPNMAIMWDSYMKVLMPILITMQIYPNDIWCNWPFLKGSAKYNNTVKEAIEWNISYYLQYHTMHLRTLRRVVATCAYCKKYDILYTACTTHSYCNTCRISISKKNNYSCLLCVE